MIRCGVMVSGLTVGTQEADMSSAISPASDDVNMWELSVRGKMWRVIKDMYRVSRSAVLLDGECSEAFDVQQGVAQGCSLSPILFSVFINGLLKEVEQAGLGVELSDGSTIGGMLFADDFVGVRNSEEELQRLAHAYCCKWRLKANVSKVP